MAGEQSSDSALGIDPPTGPACAACDRESTLPAAAAASPDWDRQTEEIFCPLCEYNLRGLIGPRCPECGYRFDWPDLLDPTRRLHPYLFEHHPEKNFRSFWKTAIGGWGPRRFWSSLHPVQPSRPRRLILYWCLAASVLLFAYAALFVLQTWTHAQRGRNVNAPLPAIYSIPWTHAQRGRNRVIPLVPPPGTGPGSTWGRMPTSNSLPLDAYLASASTLITSRDVAIAWGIPLLAALAWPWLTFLTLLIFRASMGLAKINGVHVLRCVLYCSDILLWYGFLLLVLTPLRIQANLGTGMRIRPRSSGYGIGEIEFVIALLAIGIGAYRLTVAYRRYLRFDRPAATVIASQVIVALVVFNAALGYRVWL